MKKVLIGLGSILLVGLVGLGVSAAFKSDTETKPKQEIMFSGEVGTQACCEGKTEQVAAKTSACPASAETCSETKEAVAAGSCPFSKNAAGQELTASAEAGCCADKGSCDKTEKVAASKACCDSSSAKGQQEQTVASVPAEGM